MIFSRLLGFLRSPTTIKPAQRQRYYTPEIEGLEAREVPAVITVTNASGNENVVGSLPWSVREANYASPGLDFINFNIPGAGTHVISLERTMFLNDQVVIDGKTQPGYNGSPVVYIQGNSLNPAETPSLIQLVHEPNTGTTSSNSTVQGLGFYSFQNVAISIFPGSTGNFIQDNFVGFFRADTGATFLNSGPYPSATGIAVQSSFNVIRSNTISGLSNGIVIGEDIQGSPSDIAYMTNSINENSIGTDPTGNTSDGYGNLSDGIFLGHGARENFLGPHNVISGQRSTGIEFLSATNIGNVVFRNAIGTNRGGTAVIGNGELGVLIANGATGNAVGGPFGGNLISGNALGGVSIGTDEFQNAFGNYVQDNIIGLNGTQTAALGNQGVGVSIQDGATRNVVEGNVIAGHSVHGVVMRDVVTNGVRFNWIGRNVTGTSFANGAFGIALLQGASFNFVHDNVFGTNNLGNIFVDPQAQGNAFS